MTYRELLPIVTLFYTSFSNQSLFDRIETFFSKNSAGNTVCILHSNNSTAFRLIAGIKKLCMDMFTKKKSLSSSSFLRLKVRYPFHANLKPHIENFWISPGSSILICSNIQMYYIAPSFFI